MATTKQLFTGRRKSAVARAAISRGSGQFSINGKPLDVYFPTEKMRKLVTEPFELLEQDGQWDVFATIKGGGTTGQAGALRLALSRALIDWDAEWRGQLKDAGMLTRDARKVERKKYGLKKARKAPQFSKR